MYRKKTTKGEKMKKKDKIDVLIGIIRIIVFIGGIVLITFLLYQARCYDLHKYEKIVLNRAQLGILESIAIAMIGQLFLVR